MRRPGWRGPPLMALAGPVSHKGLGVHLIMRQTAGSQEFPGTAQEPILLFDDGAQDLGPMTTLRSVFEVRTAAVTTWQRIEAFFDRPVAACAVADLLLAAVLAERRPGVLINPPDLGTGLASEARWLLINGACAGVPELKLAARLGTGESLRTRSGRLLAARWSGYQARAFLIGMDPGAAAPTWVPEEALFRRPWDVFARLEENLCADLEASALPRFRAADHPGVTHLGDHPFRVAPGARLMPGVVVDTESGPVVVETGSTINAITVLQGPCYVGRDSVVASHASVRGGAVVGPVCKVAGELSHCLFQGFSNKAHEGFLGTAYVGAWSNLGAGTVVSNLKNNYTTVRMQLYPNQSSEETGLQFQGPIIGDFVRTAIGSRLLTGSVIGTGCMLALSTFAPKTAAPFGWYTDGADGQPQRVLYGFSQFWQTAEAAAARRGLSFGSAERALLEARHRAVVTVT